jgi:hypothetical protein
MSFVIYADWAHRIDESFANVRTYRDIEALMPWNLKPIG